MHNKENVHVNRATRSSSRQSLAGAKRSAINGGNAGTTAGSRVSSSRRSSVYGTTGGAGGRAREDPRPIGQKSYTQACLRSVITYLAEHGYSEDVSAKQLTNPTVKHFSAVLGFLATRIDPNSKPFSKLDEEVPMFFKRLRYPYAISKTSLAAVGAPHTWPTLLAALAWLVSLLRYDEAAAAADAADVGAAGDGAGRGREREFYSYVVTSYTHFMAGDDATCGGVDSAYAALHLDKERALQQEIADIHADSEAKRAKIAELQGTSVLAAAREKLAEVERDNAKLQALRGSAQEYEASISKKIAERSADHSALQAQLAGLKESQAGLRARIAAQTVSVEDVARINLERSKQTGILRGASAQRAAAAESAAEAEVALEAAYDALEGTVRKYNIAADRLKLVPASTKRADGVAYELSVRRGASGVGGILAGADVRGAIRSGLQRCRDGYAARSRELSSAALAAQEKLDILGDSVAERKADAAAADSEIKRLESACAAARAGLEAALSAAASQADALQAEVAELRICGAAERDASAAALAAVQAEYAELQRSCAAEAERCAQDLHDGLEMIVQHKLGIQKQLAGVCERMTALRTAASDLPQ